MRSVRANSAGPDALMAGFETLGDGSTRLFVELTLARSNRPVGAEQDLVGRRARWVGPRQRRPVMPPKGLLDLMD